MNLWAIFLVGLTTGGVSCVAMQGGLLASMIANQDESNKQKLPAWAPVAMFLASKLIAHTILGFFLGWLGSQMELSLGMRLLFQGLAALYMLATAANLLELHPIFRYVVFQPPKFLQRLVRGSSKNTALLAPGFLGVMTIFIPCGVTQAMEVLAITSASGVQGAMIMATFVLGTSPIFAVVGLATDKLTDLYQQKFLKMAAVILMFLGLSNLNGILVVLESPITWQKIISPVTYFFSYERFAPTNSLGVAPILDGTQQLMINIDENGYSPRRLRAKSGIPIALTLQTKDAYSCATSFVMKSFDIQLQLGANDRQTVTFTPVKPGNYQFACSMGMYTGVLEVI